MRISRRVSYYLGRSFLVGYLFTIGLCVGLAYVKNLVVYGNKAVSNNLGFDLAVRLAFFKIPETVESAAPFAVLASGMIVIWRLNRHSELVAIRSAGISVWQILLPALAVAVLIGSLNVGLVNSVRAEFESIFGEIYRENFGRSSQVLRVTSAGIWFREETSEGRVLVHADRGKNTGRRIALEQATVLQYGPSGNFVTRLDADSAILRENEWYLTDVWINEPGQRAKFEDSVVLPTRLSILTVNESLTAPLLVPFWQLQDRIRLIEMSGFSTLRYDLHWHSLLATPLLLAAMMLIAATFSLRLPRMGGTMALIAVGILTGFVLMVVDDIMMELGSSRIIPAAVAAWSPALAASLLGITALLHIEDG